MTTSVEGVKKITSSTIGFGKKEILSALGDADSVILYTIVGVARDIKHGDGSYGQWTQFVGDFGARVEAGDDIGKEYRSTRCHVPQTFEDRLGNELVAKKSPVEFSIQVIAKKSDKSAGYEYACTELVPLTGSDSVARLLKASPGGSGKATKKS